MKHLCLSVGLAMSLLAATSDARPNRTVAAPPTRILQRVGIPGTARELGLGIADFPPDSSKPLQAATGPEVCYVLAGDVTVRIKGEPARTYRAGESWRMPAGVVHQTTAGPTGAKVLASWVHTPGEAFNRVLPNER